MNRSEINDSSGRGRGRRRSWPRWAAALAAIAPIGLLATACGGRSSPASATGGSTRVQAVLAYARCMRAHGVPGFPDPDSNGDFHNLDKSASSQETAANQVCHHLLNRGHQMTAAQRHHALGQLVKYAQCMRAHGVPNFPDPDTTNGGIGERTGIGFRGPGVKPTPQLKSANQACQYLANRARG